MTKPIDFLVKVAQQSNTTECIPWPYTIGILGYGQVYDYDGSRYTASRLSLIYATEQDQPSMDAAHSCRNRSCINPNHLSWKSRSENEADKLRDGTLMQGESHHKAKLTNEQVLEIRQLRKTTRLTTKELATMFNISYSSIQKIIYNKQWTHI